MRPSLGGGHRPEGGCRERRGRHLVRLALLTAFAVAPAPTIAQRVRITGLSDVNFGSIPNLLAESRRSQSICVYSQGTGGAYRVTATGTGAGSSFALSNGSSSLPYAVEWRNVSGQTSGTPLGAGVALTGQTSLGQNQFCGSGPSTTASLTVVLRAADLSQAREGSYSGSLTLLIAPE